MRVLGRRHDNFSLPVCSVFQPRVLAGQLCYFVDLNNITGVVRQGPTHGLTLFVDYNTELMVGTNTETPVNVEQYKSFPRDIG